MTNVKFPRKEIEKHIKLTKENIEKAKEEFAHLSQEILQVLKTY